MCKTESCGGCITLQTGTAIIGFIYLIVDVLALSLLAVYEIHMSHVADYEIHVTTVIIATLLETMTISTILLLVATMMKESKPMYLVPWLSIGALMAVVGIGLFFWKEIQVNSNEDFLHFTGTVISVALNGDYGTAACVLTVISLLILLVSIPYSWIVVYSYYLHQLETTKKQSQSCKPNNVDYVFDDSFVKFP